MIRLGLLVVGLALVVLIPFLIWGERFEAMFALDAAEPWFQGDGGADAAGLAAGLIVAAVGLALLVVDLFLPIPASSVMAGMGIAFGPILGGVLSALGATLSGLLAYGLSRALGPRTAERLAGAEGLASAKELFDRYGGWLVALSRWPPILPEIVACLAGLAKMPFRRFLLALICGAVPMGFVFATLGHLGRDAPMVTLAVSAGLPLVLWAILRRFALR